MSKHALIIGVTGQDGSYLAELLLSKGYFVTGLKRRSSIDTTGRLGGAKDNSRFLLLEGDVTDYASMSGILHRVMLGETNGTPLEIYNLAAQSHVGTSFEQPLATWDSTAVGVINILDALRQSGYCGSQTRFYQASTSEMFGRNYRINKVINQDGENLVKVQDEDVSFNPRSPYAVAKVAAHNMVQLYRDAYGLHGCCGILFNHESPRRGEHFVTRKITKYVGQLYHQLVAGTEKEFPLLGLGNLDANRDWGHARDYVEAMWLMMQQDEPTDYVIATGETHTVRHFCEAAFNLIGVDYKDYTYTDPKFYRPSEVDYLLGDPFKAHNKLGWEPKISFDELVREMVEEDIDKAVQ